MLAWWLAGPHGALCYPAVFCQAKNSSLGLKTIVFMVVNVVAVVSIVVVNKKIFSTYEFKFGNARRRWWQVSSVCELFLPRRGRVWKRRVRPRVHATGLKCWVPFPGGAWRTPRVPAGPVPALGQVVNVVRAHSGLQCRFRWYGAISCLFEIFKDGVERLARVRTNRAGLEAPNLVVQTCFPNAA